MTATLRLGASLKALINGQTDYVIDAGKTVKETLILVGIKPEVVALVTVNGIMETKEYVIRENDIVRLMAVIGGG